MTSVSGVEVEKEGNIEGLRYKEGIAGGPDSPNAFFVDEVKQEYEIENNSETAYTVYEYKAGKFEGKEKRPYESTWMVNFIRLQDYMIGYSGNLRITKNNKVTLPYNIIEAGPGISFIVKDGKGGYMVYYEGPGAVDTDGTIYNSADAMDFLKKQYPEKYAESEKRAEELGLGEAFRENNVLVWGQTYYSTPEELDKFWTPKGQTFPSNDQIQYDEQGNAYQCHLWMEIKEKYGYIHYDLVCINTDGKQIIKKNLAESSEILTNGEGSHSWYVGFGGNIYYYVAGDSYTEVFRIRRTWGEPDLYSMAINGYTDDSYGKYVKETLGKMSRSDLRLLRNTIFALYGYTFKSDDLAKYFNDEVWYTADGTNTTGDIEASLPENRKALLTMVQKAEKVAK
ncbi:MAG: YARHG domain-containing protein [Treponema sp.]|nr:YARHG domain-containing protein [Treponema sp.]